MLMLVQVNNNIDIAVERLQIETIVGAFVYLPWWIYKTKVKAENIFGIIVLPKIEFYPCIIFVVQIPNIGAL